MAAYDAIYFDLDSTLCEPVRSREALLEATFDHAGIEQFCTPNGIRTAAATVDTAETDFEFFRLLFIEAARRAGIEATVAADYGETLARSYLEVVDPGGVRFCPGAKDALAYADTVASVGLITNGSWETQRQKLETLELLEFFDVAVFTDPAAGVPPKPDSVPFERALSGLDADPADAVHIGDSLHADVGGANAMGMDSVWVDLGIETPSTYEPTYQVESLEELPAVL